MLKFWRRQKTNSRREGCAFFLWTCFFFARTCVLACLLLLVNSVLIKEFFVRFAPPEPGSSDRSPVIQAVMFLGPVVVLLAEWWLIDLFFDLITPKRDPDELMDKPDEAKDR